jgi:hypothetical protein
VVPRAPPAADLGVRIRSRDGRGIGLFAHQDWWQAAAIAGAALSLLLLVLFFNPWITVGVAINVAVILVLVQTD